MKSFHAPFQQHAFASHGVRVNKSLVVIRNRHRLLWEYIDGWFVLHRQGPDRQQAATEIGEAPGQRHIYSLSDTEWKILLQKWKRLSASNVPNEYHAATSAMTAVIKYLPDTFKSVNYFLHFPRSLSLDVHCESHSERVDAQKSKSNRNIHRQ